MNHLSNRLKRLRRFRMRFRGVVINEPPFDGLVLQPCKMIESDNILQDGFVQSSSASTGMQSIRRYNIFAGETFWAVLPWVEKGSGW